MRSRKTLAQVVCHLAAQQALSRATNTYLAPFDRLRGLHLHDGALTNDHRHVPWNPFGTDGSEEPYVQYGLLWTHFQFALCHYAAAAAFSVN